MQETKYWSTCHYCFLKIIKYLMDCKLLRACISYFLGCIKIDTLINTRVKCCLLLFFVKETYQIFQYPSLRHNFIPAILLFHFMITQVSYSKKYYRLNRYKIGVKVYTGKPPVTILSWVPTSSTPQCYQFTWWRM